MRERSTQLAIQKVRSRLNWILLSPSVHDDGMVSRPWTIVTVPHWRYQLFLGINFYFIIKRCRHTGIPWQRWVPPTVLRGWLCQQKSSRQRHDEVEPGRQVWRWLARRPQTRRGNLLFKSKQSIPQLGQHHILKKCSLHSALFLFAYLSRNQFSFIQYLKKIQKPV